ncbi:hypothetical protein [Phormidium sp. CCY1219]|uniref:hypothetical protein n=1 Tax=Phormidium sp. CCY1219 TaxID=2886104 RepID=UPI002D1F76AD|nr:hypothetical protein [Phormidium sp. CCY1219]MEB3831551.1 hypothetical protein [Phormidium sp. CCY1219]
MTCLSGFLASGGRSPCRQGSRFLPKWIHSWQWRSVLARSDRHAKLSAIPDNLAKITAPAVTEI